MTTDTPEEAEIRRQARAAATEARIRREEVMRSLPWRQRPSSTLLILFAMAAVFVVGVLTAHFLHL
jgi:hypothetical protein